jgi:ABC-2 type transport system permease protein
MRFVTLIHKTLVENVRDWKILILTLTFAPFFVVLMNLYFEEGTQTGRVAVVDRDGGEVAELLLSHVGDLRDSEGAPLLELRRADDLDAARALVEADEADLAVEIPTGFSAVLTEYALGTEVPPVVVRSWGDPRNVKYILTAATWDYTVFEYAAAFTGDMGPLVLEVNTIGSADALNEFEIYVPALLSLALIMLMFTAAASLIKEKDQGTLIRLRISGMTTFEWLAAITVVQMVIGLAALGLTYLTAVGLGYRAAGSVWMLMVVGLFTSASIIAISVVVAAAMRTIFDLLTIGCFPFFIMMFFSGGMLPLPDLRLFTLFGHPVNANAILPTTHTEIALGKVLNHGAGLGDVAFELAAITLLTVLYFALGTWLFTRRHMRAL